MQTVLQLAKEIRLIIWDYINILLQNRLLFLGKRILLNRILEFLDWLKVGLNLLKPKHGL